MTHPIATPVARTSADLTAERLAALRDLIPEAFGEGEVDFAKLRAVLGDSVDERPERYSFTWAGKRDAIRLLQMPTRATLVPAKDESVNWDTTQNLFIEGDNLEVLKLLYKAYYGRVKMIYIDPPYNTGNDFIYLDDYADPLRPYLQLTGQMDAAGNLLTSNTEASGRYHSAWLNMMHPRLFVARQLLCDDGVIFVSIDDNELPNLRLIMNEVFGEESFIATIIWQKMDSPSRNDPDRTISNYHDYILLYGKNADASNLFKMEKNEILEGYTIALPNGKMGRRRQLRKNGKGSRRSDRPSMWFRLTAPDGSSVFPIAPEGWEGRWVLSLETWRERERAGLTDWIERDYGWVPYYVEVAPETPTVPWSTIWTDVDQNRQAKAKFTTLMGSEIEFDNPKPVNLLCRMLEMSTSDDGIVMDFFAGSCSTAHAVVELNNLRNTSLQFVMVQLPEPVTQSKVNTIADIGKERIKRVISSSGRTGVGFRVFKLSQSHFANWSGTASATPADYHRQLEAFTDPLTQRHDAEAVIWEVAIKEGYSLTSQVEAAAVAGHVVYRVSDLDRGQHFHICLDDEVAPELVAALGLGKEDLFVCRDLALDDSAAANLALQCRLKTI